MPTPPSIPVHRKAEVADLAAFGYTDEQIADRLGCSRITVLNFRSEHGIKKKRGGFYPRKPVLAVQNTGPELPIRTYVCPELQHLVKVYAARRASGDVPLEEFP